MVVDLTTAEPIKLFSRNFMHVHLDPKVKLAVKSLYTSEYKDIGELGTVRCEVVFSKPIFEIKPIIGLLSESNRFLVDKLKEQNSNHMREVQIAVLHFIHKKDHAFDKLMKIALPKAGFQIVQQKELFP